MNLKKIIATGAVVALTFSTLPTMFAQVGDTTLDAEACLDTIAIAIYDIDFGSFTATDVLGSPVTDRAGTKNGDGQSSATELTSTDPSAVTDFMAAIDNPCYQNDWNVTIHVTDMIDQDTVNAGLTDSPIPDDNHRMDADGTLYRFQNSPANAALTAITAGSNLTYPASLPVTLLTHSAVANGIAGYYGIDLSHEMDIPADQSVDEYAGTVVLTLN